MRRDKTRRCFFCQAASSHPNAKNPRFCPKQCATLPPQKKGSTDDGREIFHNTSGPTQDTPVTCFLNQKDTNDLLCIFSNYTDGSNNLYYSDEINAKKTRKPKKHPDPTRKLRDALRDAIQFGMETFPKSQDDRSKSPTQVCIHHPQQTSVNWTHLHFFDEKDYTKPQKKKFSELPGPDGVTGWSTDVDGNAWCAPLANGAGHAANSIREQMGEYSGKGTRQADCFTLTANIAKLTATQTREPSWVTNPPATIPPQPTKTHG